MRELETKIAAWRERMSAALPGREQTVQELEEHLRDQCAALIAQGVAPEEAWLEAERRLGAVEGVAREFDRLAAPWWCGARRGIARLLAYGSGVLGVAGFAFYLGWTFWGFARLLDGRSLPVDPRWAGSWQALSVALTLASALAVRASGRFLARPSAGDLRGVIAFNLLAIWMVASGFMERLTIAHEAKVSVILGLLICVVTAWRVMGLTVRERVVAES